MNAGPATKTAPTRAGHHVRAIVHAAIHSIMDISWSFGEKVEASRWDAGKTEVL
jgi:hypothetical protein